MTIKFVAHRRAETVYGDRGVAQRQHGVYVARDGDTVIATLMASERSYRDAGASWTVCDARLRPVKTFYPQRRGVDRVRPFEAAKAYVREHAAELR